MDFLAHTPRYTSDVDANGSTRYVLAHYARSDALAWLQYLGVNTDGIYSMDIMLCAGLYLFIVDKNTHGRANKVYDAMWALALRRQWKVEDYGSFAAFRAYFPAVLER